GAPARPASADNKRPDLQLPRRGLELRSSWSCTAPQQAIRLLLVEGVHLLGESEHVIAGDNLIVLVVQHGVPADLAVVIGDARGDALGGQFDADGVVVGHRGDEAEVLQAVVGQDGARLWLNEEAGGPGDQQVAVGDATWEERVGHGGLLVHVGVEGVAGLLGEFEDLLEADLTQVGGELVADAQGGQVLAEGVHAGAGRDIRAGDTVDGRTAVPLAGDGGEVVRGALDGGALHVVLDAADTAEFLATTGAARAAVDEVWQRGAVAGGGAGVVTVEEVQAAVVGGDAHGELVGQ